MYQTISCCLGLGIRWLTLYAFSTENWRRAPDDVAVLLDATRWSTVQSRLTPFIADGLRIRTIGDIADGRIPAATRDVLNSLVESSEDNLRMQLLVAFNYGGQDELARAASQLVAAPPDHPITPADIAAHLWVPEAPPVDLLIRTSGEMRLSNFLLWQAAYAELVFLDTMWPDFGPAHLYSAIREYQSRRRRFGDEST